MRRYTARALPGTVKPDTAASRVPVGPFRRVHTEDVAPEPTTFVTNGPAVPTSLTVVPSTATPRGVVPAPNSSPTPASRHTAGCPAESASPVETGVCSEPAEAGLPSMFGVTTEIAGMPRSPPGMRFPEAASVYLTHRGRPKGNTA